MQDLKITLIQTDLHWQNVTANLSMLEEKIWQINEETDLIILPEMFNTGFTTSEASSFAEVMNMTTFKWLKQQAAQTGAVITGSFIVKEQHNLYNRLIWMRPDGSFETYDKRHLFRMAAEQETFSPGNKRLLVTLKGWNILPTICYDLRFPVWLRNQKNEYDLLICIANWPASRSLAWNTLLQARAIENISYVVGANRIGTDGNNIVYTGDSALISPKGDVLLKSHKDQEILTGILSADELINFRRLFPAYMDADDFTINY
ncbi:MAG: amidohydrolase [Cytophagaceae bacterium]